MRKWRRRRRRCWWQWPFPASSCRCRGGRKGGCPWEGRGRPAQEARQSKHWGCWSVRQVCARGVGERLGGHAALQHSAGSCATASHVPARSPKPAVRPQPTHREERWVLDGPHHHLLDQVLGCLLASNVAPVCGAGCVGMGWGLAVEAAAHKGCHRAFQRCLHLSPGCMNSSSWEGLAAAASHPACRRSPSPRCTHSRSGPGPAWPVPRAAARPALQHRQKPPAAA
jgi:hypothetical protein